MANKQKSNLNNLLGKKIKQLRLKKKLSQDELTRKADIPYTTLTKIETGVIKKPSVLCSSENCKSIKCFFR